MFLFEIPEKKTPEKTTSSSKIKLKKGQTVNDLIETARKLVEEKLGDYKNSSICVTDINKLKQFFEDTEPGSEIGIDTETTGLNPFEDLLVGLSLCNGKEALYVPVRHKSFIYQNLLENQIPAEDIIALFKEVITIKNFKWIYHNARFDLAVLRTFLDFDMPAPYWDTLIGAHVLEQLGDHNLKYLYNTCVKQEDEGVNRFDTLFKGVTFDYIPLKNLGAYNSNII